MKIEFEAPLGQRILRRRSIGITTFPINKQSRSLWWNYEKRQWSENTGGGGYSSHCDCDSYKAFLRHLKKHKEQLKGYEVILVSRFWGHNITAFVDE